MSIGPGSEAGPFRDAYVSALRDYLSDCSEGALRLAYELGREAVTRGVTVLGLAVIHHEALLSALAGASSLSDATNATRAAGEFFLESLSSFEMVERSYAETREAIVLQRRQTELWRQLSSFLADASLALDASDSIGEVLRLVAEQARELVAADCCLVTVGIEGRPRIADAASYPIDDDVRWIPFVRWLDLDAIYRLLGQSGGLTRMTGEQLTGLPFFRTVAGDASLRGWLATALTTLDGRQLGAIQAFDKQRGDFTRDDEAALIHLGQMASATIERTQLYHGPS
jgi:GAF domain-containing protein